MSANPYAGLGKPPMPAPFPGRGPAPQLPGTGIPLTGNGGTAPTTTPAPADTPATPVPTPPNVLPPGAVRPTGSAKGYDPSYLQNLATAIGGLFSRPGGNLNFNPLGNLSEISPPSGMGGTAPLPGLPSTWLQDALNGLGFSFGIPAYSTTGPGAIGGGGGGGGNDGGGGRGPRTYQ